MLLHNWIKIENSKALWEDQWMLSDWVYQFIEGDHERYH